MTREANRILPMLPITGTTKGVPEQDSGTVITPPFAVAFDWHTRLPTSAAAPAAGVVHDTVSEVLPPTATVIGKAAGATKVKPTGAAQLATSSGPVPGFDKVALPLAKVDGAPTMLIDAGLTAATGVGTPNGQSMVAVRLTGFAPAGVTTCVQVSVALTGAA